MRAYRVTGGGQIVGKTVQQAEALIPEQRVFIQRIRRGDTIMEATSDTVFREGDIVSVAGRREVLVDLIGSTAEEVNDRELLAVPIEGVDVYVTSKEVDGKTLAELADQPNARGVFLRKIVRGATATNIPILADTQLQRGDVVTLVGRTPDIAAGTKMLGHPDRATDVADVAFIGAAITIGALLGAMVYKVGSVPLTLSTSGGVLIAGLFFGWLRSVHPTFGRIPSPTVWFMNSVGLNVFIAVVGHLVRARLCSRPATAWFQPVSLGRRRHDGAADTGDVRRQVFVPVRRRHSARMLLWRTHHDCLARYAQ